jgi:hypothetical protein
MVDADVAELVDDDRRTAHAWMAEQPAQQRRLAAAQKPGDDGHRQSARQWVDRGR